MSSTRRSSDVTIPERYRHLRLTQAQWAALRSELRMVQGMTK